MFANRSSFLNNLPPIVRYLLIINVLFWLATYTFSSKVDLNVYLGMHYWQSDMFNPAQMITYMFMHNNSFFPWHLFFNMFALYMFGRVLEQVLGSKRFLFYYIACGIGAAIVQQIFWTIELQPYIKQVEQIVAETGTIDYLVQMNNNLAKVVTIGASGSVFGLLLGFGFLFPNQQILLLFPPIPIKAKYFVVIYAILELVFGVAQFSGDNIAHFAHLGGLVVGLIILWYWKKHPLDRFNKF